MFDRTVSTHFNKVGISRGAHLGYSWWLALLGHGFNIKYKVQYFYFRMVVDLVDFLYLEYYMCSCVGIFTYSYAIWHSVIKVFYVKLKLWLRPTYEEIRSSHSTSEVILDKLRHSSFCHHWNGTCTSSSCHLQPCIPASAPASALAFIWPLSVR